MELLTINDFCRAAKICKATFYALKNQGKAPVTIKLGKRTLISQQAFDKWIADLEAVAANGNETTGTVKAKRKGAR